MRIKIGFFRITVMALSMLMLAPAFAALRDESRPQWKRQPAPFIRTWLICGEFPNPPDEAGNKYNLLPYGARAMLHKSLGFNNDYLQARGGEAAIRPVEGMTHKRAVDSTATWKEYVSDRDAIRFGDALINRPSYDVIGYAFTTINRPKAGKAVLSIGSSDGVKVWLNGKLVHEYLAARPARPDDDLIPVNLQAGDNAILVKVEQRSGGWAFYCRILEMADARLIELTSGSLSPLLETAGTDDHPLIKVLTNGHRVALQPEQPEVEVSSIAPGGKVMDAKKAQRGETITFDPGKWPAGCYDIRCTLTTPKGYRVTRSLLWYKGNALAAAKRILQTAPLDPSFDQRGLIHELLASLITVRLGEDLTMVKPEWLPSIFPVLREFDEIQLVVRGEDGPVHPGGFVRLAYRDMVDGSPQYARAYLPPDYTPDKKWPLVINLHGYDGSFTPYMLTGGVTQNFDGAADRYHVITLYPFGRGSIWYRGVGDQDIVRSIEMAKRQFSVDDDRVYLMGYSMGGAGTYNVASRHPDLFAAIAPVYGGYDYRFQMEDDALLETTERQRARIERQSCFAQLECLLNVPMLLNQGDKDSVVVPEYSRFVARNMQRWGYDIRYWEHPGKGHESLNNEDEIFAWLLSHRRVNNPPRVRVRAIELKTAAAHWVRVEQRDNPDNFINVDAEVVAPNVIRLDTDNVLAISLKLADAPVDKGKPVKIVWNGEDERNIDLPENGAITLNAPGYMPPKLAKRPALEGPISDVYAQPFIIVQGTISADPAMKAFCAARARELSTSWSDKQRWSPFFIKDTDVTQGIAENYSLLLVGGPDENAVTKMMREKLPVQMSQFNITLDGAKFKVRDTALRMVYPNPYNSDCYVVVLAATSPSGMYFAYSSWSDMDFSMVDGRRPSWDAGRIWEKIRIAAGYFDNAWRYREDFVERGDPDKSANLPMRKAPTLFSAVSTADRIFLSDLLEWRADGAFRFMMRNANWQGNRIDLGGVSFDNGIAIGPWPGPNAVEYDLTGSDWHWLRGTIGIEPERGKAAVLEKRKAVQLVIMVKGDGELLYQSPILYYDAKPRDINIDISGVKQLRIEVANLNEKTIVRSVNFGNLRVTR